MIPVSSSWDSFADEHPSRARIAWRKVRTDNRLPGEKPVAPWHLHPWPDSSVLRISWAFVVATQGL